MTPVRKNIRDREFTREELVSASERHLADLKRYSRGIATLDLPQGQPRRITAETSSGMSSPAAACAGA